MFQRFFGAQDTQTETTSEVDVAEAHRLNQEGAQLIDVREPFQFAAGHARGHAIFPWDKSLIE